MSQVVVNQANAKTDNSNNSQENSQSNCEQPPVEEKQDCKCKSYTFIFNFS